MKKLIILVLLLPVAAAGWANGDIQAPTASSNCGAASVSNVAGNAASQGSCAAGCTLIDLRVLAMMAADWLTCIDPEVMNCQHPWEP